MTIQEIIEKLEDLKCEIWEHCEWEKNYTQIKVKNTTNLLLDLLEELNEVKNDTTK